MPRCSATKNNGQPCKAWAVQATNPPRCASHGGTKKPPGAPAGNTNARTHGTYTKLDTAAPINLSQAIAALQARLRQLARYIDDNLVDLDAETFVKLASLQGALTSRLGRLVRDQQQAAGPADQQLSQAVAEALDEISKEWGVDL